MSVAPQEYVPFVAAPVPRSRVVSRVRPLGMLHFADPRHWTPRDASAAFGQTSQALMDTAVLAMFRTTRTHRTDAEMRRINHEAAHALSIYATTGWLANPRLAYADQRAPAPREVRVEKARAGRLDYEHVSFPSSYSPHPGDPSGKRWQSHEHNRNVHAWVLRHREPRPWIVMVHGSGMGKPRGDMRISRAAWLHHALGLNVAMPILPLHGPRSTTGLHFPSEDVLNNLHGVLQGVADVRRTIAWARSLGGDQRVGIHGISLGGYTTALVASTEPNLACAILGVAPVDLVLLMERHHGTGHGHDLRVRNFEIGAQLAPMVSPLKLQPLLPGDRRFIYAGVVDRLVDFSEHVAPMIAHWDYPETLVYDGGHVGLGMAKFIPGFIARSLASSGLIKRR